MLIRELYPQGCLFVKSVRYYLCYIVIFYGCFSCFLVHSEEVSMKRPFLWIEDKKNLLWIRSFHSLFDEKKLSLSHGKIKKISQSNNGQLITIELENDVEFGKDFYLKYKNEILYAYPRFSFLNKYYFYDQNDLGPQKINDHLELKLWSPTAVSVTLIVLDKQENEIIFQEKAIKKNQGVWHIKYLDLKYLNHPYYFKVEAFGKSFKALDPYAKAMTAFSFAKKTGGHGILAPLVSEEKYSSIKNLFSKSDYIGYELHVRDFSISEDSGIIEKERGTFKGLESKISYFKDLGVTHLQLMPIQNFYTVDDENQTFQGENIPSNKINYNWGYDPHHYFALENWYFTNPRDPLKGIEEFKNFVKSLHRENIGVIIDVVYNHLYDQEMLENSAPGCYMRRFENGLYSYHSGAGASLESRNLMTRKIIIDSLKFYQNFYKIDGFRFDLMSFLDIQTLHEIRQALGKNTILYGEAWEFTDLPKNEAVTKSNMPDLSNEISAFNDTSRDSYTGFEIHPGFVQGNAEEISKVMAGVIGSISDYPNPLVSQDRYHVFAQGPIQTLNFLTIHDGLTLWDKLNLSGVSSKKKRIELVKMALAMLLTSQGRIVLQGGIEFARTRPLMKNDPSQKTGVTSSLVTSENDHVFFQKNAYHSPDSSNQISWKRTKEFEEITHYLKGLIYLRRNLPAFRMDSGDEIKNYLEFTFPEVKKKSPKKSLFKKFSDKGLAYLNLHFKNAPKEVYGKRFYIAGEVHRGNNKNPLKNPFHIKFDQNGRASIRFEKNEIKKFDLSAWSDPDGLQIKLVAKPKTWDTIPEAYTPMGNNSIHPRVIDKNLTVEIDLSKKNHNGDVEELNSNLPLLAFRLKNGQKIYSEFLVIYNAQDKDVLLSQNFIDHPDEWKVLLDKTKSDINGIQNSDISIQKGRVYITSKTVSILGKLR